MKNRRTRPEAQEEEREEGEATESQNEEPQGSGEWMISRAFTGTRGEQSSEWVKCRVVLMGFCALEAC